MKTSEGTIFESQNELKQLGFYFGNKPNVRNHISHLKKKFRARLWILRHLQRASLSDDDLLAMYKCFILTVLDFSAVVYHSMLSREQSDELEGLQRAALKVTFWMEDELLRNNATS